MFPTDSYVKGLVPGRSAIWEKGQKLRVGEWLDETGYWGGGGEGGMSMGVLSGSGPFLSPLCSWLLWGEQLQPHVPNAVILRLRGMGPTNQGLKL